eukprot:scaffold2341_cov212-Skeletonema_menzelii.AAC.11
MNHGTHLLIIGHRLQSPVAEPASRRRRCVRMETMGGGGRIASGRPAEGSGRHGGLLANHVDRTMIEKL